MSDPVAGLREMARVTREGGIVAACVWDLAGGRGRSAPSGRRRTRSTTTCWTSPGSRAREGHLAELFEAAGLDGLEATTLSVSLEHPSFEDWWEPFTLGVGPAGAYAVGLDPEKQARLRERCRELLPEPPFVLTSSAWATRAVV